MPMTRLYSPLKCERKSRKPTGWFGTKAPPSPISHIDRTSDLHHAARIGDEREIQRIYKKLSRIAPQTTGTRRHASTDPTNRIPHCLDARNRSGETAFFVAAAAGQNLSLALLYKLGANPRIPNSEGMSPVYIAASCGLSDTILSIHHLTSRGKTIGKSVSDKSVLLTKPSNDGATPLYIASQQGHVSCVNTLIQLVTRETNDCLSDGLRRDGKETSPRAAKKVTDRSFINTPNLKGMTPLFIAAHSGHLDAVEALLSAGADVHQSDYNGATPVYVASCRGHVDVLRALINNGGDASTPNHQGVTPVHVASNEGQVEVIRLLFCCNNSAPLTGGLIQ